MNLSIALSTFLLIWDWSENQSAAFTNVGGISSLRSFSRTTTTHRLASATNNVILRPTTQSSQKTQNDGDKKKDSEEESSSFEDVFDSFQIGSPIVHRYKKTPSFLMESPPTSMADAEDYDDVNYVMWYHGRSIVQESEKDDDGDDDSNASLLPPLSTGRIGRATSRNGLIFEKNTKGAIGEDIKGVSLGLNKESWWGFDTAHVGLGSVLLPMTTPAVMTDGGIYLMYYFGGNFEETNINTYSNNPAIPPDSKIKGMKMRIGVAVSQDGESWGRVEGDDPTGACMVPYDKSDPDTAMSDGSSDDNNKNLVEELYCAWPEVVVRIVDEDQSTKKRRGLLNTNNGSSNNDKSGFFMYYSTMTKETKTKAIAVAVSDDGFRWYKRGLCIQPRDDDDDDDNSASFFDDGGCARCNVVRNASYNENTEEWSDEPGYTMYYEGVWTKDNKHRILSATSSDGLTWTKNKEELVLDIGTTSDAWDCDGVGSPHILRTDDGSQRMYYVGQQGKNTAIGVAKMELGSNKWVKEQSSFVFAEV